MCIVGFIHKLVLFRGELTKRFASVFVFACSLNTIYIILLYYLCFIYIKFLIFVALS